MSAEGKISADQARSADYYARLQKMEAEVESGS